MYHTIIIAGNVGKDPEMRYTPSGQAVTSFSVATNRQYTTGNGEQVKETIWFRISTWGKTAEICNQYVKKGSKVLIEGRLTGSSLIEIYKADNDALAIRPLAEESLADLETLASGEGRSDESFKAGEMILR